MKGIIQVSAIVALASLGASASAQNLIHNGNFEDSHGHASLLGWGVLGIDNAGTSTFGTPPYAGYVNGLGSFFQLVDLTAGDTYDLSGQAALFKKAGDEISVSHLFNAPLVENDVTGNFSYNFTVTNSGLYAVTLQGFGNILKGDKSEFSGVSLTQVASTTPTPEPCSMIAMGVGLMGVIRARKRR